MNIEKLIKEAHENAVEKGFYDCKNPIHKKEDYQGYCCTCGGQNIDPNKNIGELLMLIVSELGEALEAHRCGRFAEKEEWDYLNRQKTGSNSWCRRFYSYIKDTFEDEIADVFIRLFDLCGYLGIKLTYRQFRLHQNYREFGNNVGADLFYLSCKLPPDTGYDKLEITSLDLVFSLLLDFCGHHNIPIEKHIEAKMAYNKTRPRKHGKAY